MRSIQEKLKAAKAVLDNTAARYEGRAIPEAERLIDAALAEMATLAEEVALSNSVIDEVIAEEKAEELAALNADLASARAVLSYVSESLDKANGGSYPVDKAAERAALELAALREQLKAEVANAVDIWKEREELRAKLKAAEREREEFRDKFGREFVRAQGAVETRDMLIAEHGLDRARANAAEKEREAWKANADRQRRVVDAMEAKQNELCSLLATAEQRIAEAVALMREASGGNEDEGVPCWCDPAKPHDNRCFLLRGVWLALAADPKGGA